MSNDEQILSLIPKGKKNGIKMSEIEALLGYNRRQITDSISRLRRQGVIICSSVYIGGYYKPENKEELEEWLKIEKKRIKTHREALKPAKKVLDNWTEV
jgi:biotin operon repressor